MSTDYHRRLQPVIRYLEQHYRDPPDLTTIAALASLSPYHFHRIFTAVTGETLAAYLRRLRLENIARQLFYGKADITTLALEHGYASSQALAKAFRAHFGITASELRTCQDFASYRRVLQNSKIGHGLRKNGHAAASTAAYTAREPKQESNMTTLHTEQFAPRTLWPTSASPVPTASATKKRPDASTNGRAHTVWRMANASSSTSTTPKSPQSNAAAPTSA